MVFLYLLVEITDDVLFDQHANPLHLYWDDDCIEIFIDSLPFFVIEYMMLTTLNII